MNNGRLFFDIETSFNIGWFWRSGYNQTISPEQIIEERKVICISWKWEGDDEVYHLTWDKNQNDKKMIQKFVKVMHKADEIIAHNGDRFDVKWLKTRALYHGIATLPKYKTFDTLKSVRSHFNFNSNKLDYIAKFLKVGGKIETGGIDLWKKIIFDKDEESLKKMVEYCDNDVIILEKVFNKIKNATVHKINYATLKGYEKFCCPECSSKSVRLSKTTTTAMGTFRRQLRCKKCDKSFTVSNKVYMDLLQYKIKNNLK
jgi:DNA polymerase elongation subunit (family B)